MSIFKAFLFGFILNLTVFGMGYGLICAADVELILGTSSAFNVVRGTTVASGTSTIYVGSATVSINSNTQGAMLYIAGSSSANTDASLHVVNTSGTSTLYVRNDGRVGIGTTTPATALHVIGTATVSGGVIIGDGTAIVKVLSAKASLDFASTAARSSSDGTITVTGASLSDVIAIGVPKDSASANSNYSAWVSAADSVVVRFNNYTNGAMDPAAGTFTVMVIKF